MFQTFRAPSPHLFTRVWHQSWCRRLEQMRDTLLRESIWLLLSLWQPCSGGLQAVEFVSAREASSADVKSPTTKEIWLILPRNSAWVIIRLEYDTKLDNTV